MIRLILFTIVGFGLFFAGVRFGYLYLMTTDAGASYSMLYIIPTLICLGLAAVSLYFAGRSKHIFPTEYKETEPAKNDPSIKTIGLQTSIENQNFIISQWRKTNHIRDKLKTMKLSAAEQQKPKF